MNLRALLAVGASIAMAGAAAFAAAPVLAAQQVPPGIVADILPAAPGPQAVGVAAGSAAPKGAASAGVTAQPAGAGCSDAACELSYQGGPVQHAPHVYLLLWGPKWSSEATAKKAYNYLYWFYHGLGQTPSDSWSTITSAYAGSGGTPAFGQSVLAGSFADTHTPPDPVTPADLMAEASRLTSRFADLTDAQVVVASQPGTCFSDGFAGNAKSCAPAPPSHYCAWHSFVPASGGDLAFTNLPFQLDAGASCGESAVNRGTGGQLDGFSATAGAEYADTITDPVPPTGWVGSTAGGEIGSPCAPEATRPRSAAPRGDLDLPVPVGKTTVSFPFAVQSLWSNALRRCILTTRPVLKVPVPGTLKATMGKAVKYQVGAAANTGTGLAFAARGLPPGLVIGSATGLITGKPHAVTAGTWRVTVTVSDPLRYAASRLVSFRLLLGSPWGAMAGTWSKCVDDLGGNNGNGARIDLYTCNGSVPQRIAFGSNGQLNMNYRCITGGRVAYIDPCKDAPDQVWTRLADGEYVLKANGKCLSDPSNTRSNGTQLVLLTCRDTVNQRWSLP